MTAVIQLRRDLASNWISENPIPRQGEPCIELDTGKMKLGDGVTNWNALAYLTADVSINDDDSPTLGGNLNCDDYEIQFHDTLLRFYTADTLHSVTIGVGAATTNLSFVLPASYGTTRQVLMSNGTGTLEFSWFYEYIERTQLGNVTVGNLMYFVAERDIEIVSAKMYLTDRPELGAVAVDVRVGENISADTILSGGSMSISYDDTAADHIYSTTGVLTGSTISVSAGQVVWFTVLSAGTTGMVPGKNLLIKLTYR